jgi:hypothetical protein
MAYGTNGTDSATNHMLYSGTDIPLLYWTCAFSEVDVTLLQTVFRQTVYSHVYAIIIILIDLLLFLFSNQYRRLEQKPEYFGYLASSLMYEVCECYDKLS